jgi:putative ABC transport system permease protein
MHDWRSEIVARLERTSLRPGLEADLVEELSLHLAEQYDELIADGATPAQAEAKVLHDLDTMDLPAAARAKAMSWRPDAAPLGGGNSDGIKGILSDLRFGARQLTRNRGLALVAIATLAIGIGANTAIFSAVNAVILRPLPFPEPGELYRIWEENPEMGWYKETAAPANFLDWREGVEAFRDAAAYNPPGDEGGRTLSADGNPTLARTAQVTGNFFDVLGIAAQSGRMLRDEETWNSTQATAIVSERFRRTHFGTEPLIGRQIDLNGESYTVVGIAPESFDFPNNPDVWVPFRWDPADRAQVWFRRAHWISVIARLESGATAEQANNQLQAVVQRLKTEYPETNRVMGAGMTPLHEFIVGDTRTPLFVLLAAVALLFLIACANVGNLLLVRAAARSRELAVRRSLGATPARLVRQLLTEGIVLAGAGAIAGIGIGVLLTKLLEQLQPRGLLSATDFTMDTRVVAYITAITLLAGLVFGAIPSISILRRGPGATLRESSRSGAPGRTTRRVANTLVVAEVAIAVLLVMGAGLLVRTFQQLRNVDPGVDTSNVLAVRFALGSTRYDDDAVARQFPLELQSRVGGLAGVTKVAVSTTTPLGGTAWTSNFAVKGRAREAYGNNIAHRSISPSYFEAMGVPLIAGRGFTAADNADAPAVVIINKATADRYFAGEDPIGQMMSFDQYPDSTSTWHQIVGIAADERQGGLGAEPRIEVFQPLEQEVPRSFALLVRTAGDPTGLTPTVRQITTELDPDLVLQSVTTLARVRGETIARERFLMSVLLLFGVVALLLSVVGVYGVTAQSARQRRQEIGVRLAMGANARDILAMVLRQGARLIVAGVLIGVLASLGATRAIASLLFGITPNDPLTFSAVALLLLIVGLAGCLIPARAAGRGDPAIVLRSE